MKKSQITVCKTKVHCISCKHIYEITSVSDRDIKISSCKNCVFPGALVSEAKIGQVEKFYQKMRKFKELSK